MIMHIIVHVCQGCGVVTIYILRTIAWLLKSINNHHLKVESGSENLNLHYLIPQSTSCDLKASLVPWNVSSYIIISRKKSMSD